LQSLLTSIFIWQPLTCYVVTWLKLWMFTYNVRMGLGPPKIIRFFKRCCGCWTPLDKYEDLEKNMKFSLVSHQSRPLDMIGFLGTDALFLDRKIVDKENEDANDDDNMEVELAQMDGIGNDHALMEEGNGAGTVVHDDENDNAGSDDEGNGVNVTQGNGNEVKAAYLEDASPNNAKKIIKNENDHHGHERKESYVPHDDPNQMGQMGHEVNSSRLDIDEIAEQYFGDDNEKKEHKSMATASLQLDIDEMMGQYFDNDEEAKKDENETPP